MTKGFAGPVGFSGKADFSDIISSAGYLRLLNAVSYFGLDSCFL
jgi:hypothetical protein